MIFIAERANGGGRVLGFIMPSVSGDLMPSFDDAFPGASAVYLSSDAMKRLFARDVVTEMNMNVEVMNEGFSPGYESNSTSVEELSTIEYGELNFKLFPNPASDVINLDVTGDMDKFENTSVEIFNISGMKLHSERNSTSKNRIDVSSFESGQYYLRLSNDKYQEVIKFSKI